MAETWPSESVFGAFVERMPARDRLFRDSLTRLNEYVARNGQDQMVLDTRRAMVEARTAYRQLDDELRVDWDSLKERDPRLREAEREYWARQTSAGQQNVRGVGLAPAVVVLFVVMILAIGAVGVLINESYQKRRPSLIAAYTRANIATQNAAEKRRIFADTRDPSILDPIPDMPTREPTTGEVVGGTLAPVALAVGIGLVLWFFGKARAR